MSIDDRIRVLDPAAGDEVALVARRMRATLSEVLDEERSVSMYSLESLEARVRWHLDPEQCTGQVFLIEDGDGRIAGHTIVRIDQDDDGEIGLFSTTYVEPASRRAGLARRLLARGEAWMREHGLERAVTYTAHDNTKLQELYLGCGYVLTTMNEEFVSLSRPLEARGDDAGDDAGDAP